MKKYGLAGYPLGHSMSAVIHKKLLGLKNIACDYTLAEMNPLDINVLSSFDGFNVTIPYKKEIIPFLAAADEKVHLYEACNTVKNDGGKLHGYNTDVCGFLRTFSAGNIGFEGKKVLVSGAGGVSSMMVCECLLRGADVSVSCRSEEKARKFIAETEKKCSKKAKFVPKEEISDFDIYLNGTPCGMYPHCFSSYIPLASLKNIPVVFDTVYNPLKTLTLRTAEYFGNTPLCGLDMLVMQAAAAQEIFNGISFDNDEIHTTSEYTKQFIPPFSVEKNIIIIGPPGSGKSTAALELAKILSAPFTDTDAEIVKQENMPINDIFAKYGEDHFRQTERTVFAAAVSQRGRIIATGGGLPVYNDMQALDKSKNIVVFLDASANVLCERLKDNNDRPLLAGNKQEKIAETVAKRHDIYAAGSDCIIKIKGNGSKKNTIVHILDEIKSN